MFLFETRQHGPCGEVPNMKYEGACSIFLSSVRFGKLCRDLVDGPKLGAHIMFDDLLWRSYSSFMEQCIAEELN